MKRIQQITRYYQERIPAFIAVVLLAFAICRNRDPPTSTGEECAI